MTNQPSEKALKHDGLQASRFDIRLFTGACEPVPVDIREKDPKEIAN